MKQEQILLNESDLARVTLLKDNLQSAALEGENAEFVDTAADFVEIVQIVERALGPDQDFVNRIIRLASAQPIVTEVIRDAAIAFQQVRNVVGSQGRETGLAIYDEAERRGPVGPVSRWVMNGVLMVGDAYEVIDSVVAQLIGLKDRGGLFFQGTDMRPIVVDLG